jgi:hypothetical protein
MAFIVASRYIVTRCCALGAKRRLIDRSRTGRQQYM